MQQLETTVETPNSNEDGSVQETPINQTDRLARWLVDEQPDESPNPDVNETSAANPAEKQKKGKATKPKVLKELAERLELEDKDLYAIEVPMSDGKSMSIGQLKDAAAKQDEFTIRELQWEEERINKEAEFRQAQDQLRVLLNALPKSALSPAILEKARQQHETMVKTERAKTLDAIPEWKNVEVAQRDLEGMVEHLSSYGYPKEYLAQIHDHRTLKYIRDNYLREQRVRRALEKVQKEKTAALNKSKPTAKGKPATSTNPGSRDAQRMQRKLDQWTRGTNN